MMTPLLAQTLLGARNATMTMGRTYTELWESFITFIKVISALVGIPTWCAFLPAKALLVVFTILLSIFHLLYFIISIQHYLY